MKRTTLPYAVLLLGCVVAGCDSGGAVDKCASVTCSGLQTCNVGSGVCENPAVPLLAESALLDRMGRPGINTALTNPFDFLQVNRQPELSDPTKDRYNRDANPRGWVPAWRDAIAFHLAIFDALDNTCGNQALYYSANANTPLGFTRYNVLAELLADDVIQVDTSKTACNQYLGAELAYAGAQISDCGGRRLDYDVIDVTYSALAAGTLSGVTDGIARTATATATFPFMAAPQ